MYSVTQDPDPNSDEYHSKQPLDHNEITWLADYYERNKYVGHTHAQLDGDVPRTLLVMNVNQKNQLEATQSLPVNNPIPAKIMTITAAMYAMGQEIGAIALDNYVIINIIRYATYISRKLNDVETKLDKATKRIGSLKLELMNANHRVSRMEQEKTETPPFFTKGWRKLMKGFGHNQEMIDMCMDRFNYMDISEDKDYLAVLKVLEVIVIRGNQDRPIKRLSFIGHYGASMFNYIMDEGYIQIELIRKARSDRSYYEIELTPKGKYFYAQYAVNLFTDAIFGRDHAGDMLLVASVHGKETND